MTDDGGDMSDTGEEGESMETGTVEKLCAGLKDREISDFKTSLHTQRGNEKRT